MQKKFVGFILMLVLSINTFGQSKAQFSKENILSDLKTLSETLEETHYNLYVYTPKQEFDAAYQRIKQSIRKDSFSLLEAFNIFQELMSVVDNGHTEIDFPIQSYMEYAYTGGTLFPFEIAFENGQPLIRKNWSTDNNIKIGSEVLSINGLSMAAILEKIYPQVSAERPYFKNTKIEVYSFPRYYWRVFGKQDNFEVEIKSDGIVKKHQLKAADLVQDFELKRDEILNAKMEVKFFDKIAYLNPGNFDGDEQKYRHFIDSAFAEIKEQKAKKLILDLRNNGGGNDPYSDYLVSYIANKPFKWCSNFSLKTSQPLKEYVRANYDTTEVFWKEVLTHKNGAIYDYEYELYQPQPKAKRFTKNKKIYVLVNRQSHSQSAVTAAQIQDYKFGTIVGEETGDYPSLYASQFKYTLPNTGILVKVSKGYMVRVNGSKKEEGVIPDILIKDYLLDEEDEILDGLLEKIGEKY